MQLKATVAVILALATSALADGKTPALAVGQVTVYVENDKAVEIIALQRAKYLARKMFANIGVSVNWDAGKPAPRETTVTTVRLVTCVPVQLKPGVLGYSVISPDSAAEVFVLVPRIRKAVDPELLPTLLAHLMVHELTHVMQKVGRHSETGLMKERWTTDDYTAMARKPLAFTPIDVNMIHYRLGLQ